MTTPGSTRRTVLAGAAGTAAAGVGVGAGLGTGLGTGAAASDATTATTATTATRRTSAQVFAHGVASGDPLPDGVVLWTRVTPTAAATAGSGRGPEATVVWEVATDAGFRRVVRTGRFVTSAARDHTVKVDVRGLRPGTRYWYRFRHAGVASRTGRTRTAPAVSATPERLRFGFVSCANHQAGFFGAYRHLADHDLDAVLHLGDYLYEGGASSSAPAGRAHVPAREIVSLADYRQRHAQYKRDPDLALLHARHPFVTTWDDHESANDSWRGGAENHTGGGGPGGEGSWTLRRARAHRAYDEWMPVRLDGTAALGDGSRLYRRLRFGTLADLSMLDLRSYRDQQVVDPYLAPAVDDPDRTITGGPQMAWLKRQLSDDTTRWRLVGTSVVIAPLTLAQLPRTVAEPLAEVLGASLPASVRGDGVVLNADQWDGYTDDRRELFDHLAAEGVDNAVFLSGDVHFGIAADLPLDTGAYPLGGTAGVEFTCASVTSSNLDEQTDAPPRTASLAAEAVLRGANRHLQHLDLDSHGFCVLDVTAERVQADYYVLEDKMDPRSPVSWSTGLACADGAGRLTPASAPAVAR